MKLHRYSIAVLVTGVLAAHTYLELLAGANRFAVRGVSMVMDPSAATGVGLIRSTAVGTSTAAVVLQPHDPASPVASTVVSTTWSSEATIASPAAYHRSFLVTDTGTMASMAWPFDSPSSHESSLEHVDMFCAKGGSWLIWNNGANTSGDIQFTLTIDEYIS